MLLIDDNLDDAMLFSTGTEAEALSYLEREWNKIVAYNNRNGFPHLNHLTNLRMIVSDASNKQLLTAMDELNLGVSMKSVANFLGAYKTAHMEVWGWHKNIAEYYKNSINKRRSEIKRAIRVGLQSVNRKAPTKQKEFHQCRLGEWKDNVFRESSLQEGKRRSNNRS